MTIAYVTGACGAHIIDVADELYKILGNRFTLIETKTQDPMMFRNAAPRSYMLRAYESDELRTKAQGIIDAVDVVRIGGAPFTYVENRIKNNKLTFRSSERWFKHSAYRVLLNPKNLIMFYRQHFLMRSKNVYLLTMSAYLPNDANLLHCYPNRIYKYGYIIKCPEYNVKDSLIVRRRKIVKILWCARFVRVKCAYLIPILAKKLIDNGCTSFVIEMIGNGEYYNQISEDIKNLHVEKYVTLLGAMSNEQVKEKMRDSNIFLFTSHRGEGWGVVLNEAMSASCAVVASNTIGAVPYLLSNGINGLIFKSEDLDSLYNATRILIENQDIREKYAMNAYNTIKNEWSPAAAAERFVKLSEYLLSNREGSPFNEGLCSIVKPIDADMLYKNK